MIFFINCKYKLEEFDNTFIAKTETRYIHKAESEKINIILSSVIKNHELMGYKFCCIKQMGILILIDRCNLTYNEYMKGPLSMVERQINFNIAKIPSLMNSLDRNKNHPLIKKHSHIP